MLEFLAVCGALSLGYAFGEIARHVIDRLSARYEKPAPVGPAPTVVAQPELITDDEFTIVNRWVKLNSWYINNTALNQEAQMIHLTLRNREPHLTFEANLAHVTAEMHRRHPEIVPTRQ
jgi:hypothetical protein